MDAHNSTCLRTLGGTPTLFYRVGFLELHKCCVCVCVRACFTKDPPAAQKLVPTFSRGSLYGGADSTPQCL